MFGFDAAWVSSWDPLRPLCPYQMIISPAYHGLLSPELEH
ncbi:unnamed protein product, partial [Brassica rapa subsp. trilocularis]